MPLPTSALYSMPACARCDQQQNFDRGATPYRSTINRDRSTINRASIRYSLHLWFRSIMLLSCSNKCLVQYVTWKAAASASGTGISCLQVQSGGEAAGSVAYLSNSLSHSLHGAFVYVQPRF